MVNFNNKGLQGSPARPRAALIRTTVVVGATAVAGLAVHRTINAKRQGNQPAPKFLLPVPVVDAISGAVGEVSQIVLLYPLETIKVRCQADGISTMAAIRELAKNGPAAMVQSLYAGLGSATLFSIVVGAMHWLSFCSAKRAALKHMEEADAAAAAKAGKTAAVGGKDEKKELKHAHVHVISSHHMHEEDVDVRTSPTTGESPDLQRVAAANMVGATVGAVFTALVEGPLELFRHQAQAGLISGNLFKEMVNCVKTQGPLGLYWGFLPYCLESFPYDISELSTYSQLRDMYNDAVNRSSNRLHGVVSKLPPHFWDIAMGAAAGSAATLISMPFDVVKTYMQTHCAEAVGQSAAGQVVYFFKTGVRMVQQRGPGALWVGVVPRLMQQVPSCTICWWAVEATQQWLKPWTAKDESEDKYRAAHA